VVNKQISGSGLFTVSCSPVESVIIILSVLYFTCYLCDGMKCDLENRHLSTQLPESVT
jgi:hypothetical protein